MQCVDMRWWPFDELANSLLFVQQVPVSSVEDGRPIETLAVERYQHVGLSDALPQRLEHGALLPVMLGQQQFHRQPIVHFA